MKSTATTRTERDERTNAQSVSWNAAPVPVASGSGLPEHVQRRNRRVAEAYRVGHPGDGLRRASHLGHGRNAASPVADLPGSRVSCVGSLRLQLAFLKINGRNLQAQG